MPVISDLSITSATIIEETGVLAVVGVAFSELQGDAGKVRYRINAGAWSDVTSYASWGDSLIICSLALPLAPGLYDVYVINGDNESSDPLVAAFDIAAGQIFFNYVTSHNCK